MVYYESYAVDMLPCSDAILCDIDAPERSPVAVDLPPGFPIWNAAPKTERSFEIGDSHCLST